MTDGQTDDEGLLDLKDSQNTRSTEEDGGHNVLSPPSLATTSICVTPASPKQDYYFESVYSSSFEGNQGIGGSGSSYTQNTPETCPPSPLLTGDEASLDRKKKNKKIKRAMKHISQLGRKKIPDPCDSGLSDFESGAVSSTSGVSFFSSLAHMLPNTNPKSREHDFHKLFKSLPEGETLIQDFSCALLRDILVQGRLYVSQNWFCFYANILGWETLLTIEVNKIIAIKKEKTALVINNAISISTHEEKYFFSSFMSRDSAHNHMAGIWRTAGVARGGLHDSLDMSTNGEDLVDDNSDSMVSEDEEGGGDELHPHQRPHLSHSLGLVLNRPNPNSAHGLAVPSDVGARETISFNEEDDTCVCVSHLDIEHLNQDFEMNIEKMYKLLFNDDSSVQSKMRTHLKMEDYESTAWQDSVEGANERTLNYKIPLNANLGPKWAEVIEKQVLTTTSVATRCYVVNCEVTNPNVPYGDKFSILKRYCMTRSSDTSCKLRLTSDVHYRKGVWGMVKSIIEKNSKEGINEYCEDLGMCLQEESAGPGIKIRKSASSAGAHTSASSTRVARPRSQAAVSDTQLQGRPQTAMSYISNNYIPLILLMMAVLMMLNLVLVYRLSSISSSCTNQFDILNSLPHSEEGKSEWIRILSQQQDLHKKEIERWQDVLRWITKLVSEVHGSLDKLQKSSIYTHDLSSVDRSDL